MSDELAWDVVERLCEEPLTEDDIKNAENGGGGNIPAGKYLCEVVESKPQMVNPAGKSSYHVAVLKLKIEQVLKIDDRPATTTEKNLYEGRFVWDRVALPSSDEKDAIRNRRICILKRGGIISDSSTKTPRDAFSRQIIGKKYIIDMINNNYTDKDGNDRKNTKVAMFGYGALEDMEKVSEQDIADI